MSSPEVRRPGSPLAGSSTVQGDSIRFPILGSRTNLPFTLHIFCFCGRTCDEYDDRLHLAPALSHALVSTGVVHVLRGRRVPPPSIFRDLGQRGPASPSLGQRSRHRLNQGGDRALNRALHTVAITRLRCHPQSRAYEARRALEGKTHRDIRRCLKRTLARKLYRVMESATRDANAQISG
ncbi:transposase [Rhodococcus sp. (in: high G+C Gram-positive bacteria)]|uniref:transposase n=1 Tax=Rhodococcus sp. TaxID=1831 RepID=UPI00338F9FD4